MALVNRYRHRKVADNDARACEVCFKPSTSVLITEAEDTVSTAEFVNLFFQKKKKGGGGDFGKERRRREENFFWNCGQEDMFDTFHMDVIPWFLMVGTAYHVMLWLDFFVP
jgi:hypothetical protein